ncbi:ADP-heptose:LPS heptosyltransferase [Bradyrhizobium huanghuaihaiense]|uniref:ADP-heptose:LPS heptosyltransferase n=1 Tax=Bradyrhizobium huanghuaihaiense TaxID=990078 RepID=A0A562QU09_9BRAD|nr:glycosyltransferase family 9 protein [Bradyrhizobium huanghuaihaiense]TWI60262.1 ADP-heptose:LPS heptosyltransferase [Bradyrhizobium huanghuaihaiense]
MGWRRDSRKPVIFFSSGIGDGVLALPALRALCYGFEGRAYVVLKNGPDKFLFEGLNARKLLFLDMWQSASGLGAEFQTEATTKLLSGCDLFLSFVEWRSASLDNLIFNSMSQSLPNHSAEENLLDSLDIQQHSFDLIFEVVKRIFPELDLNQFSEPLTFSHEVVGAGLEILGTLYGRTLIGFHPESSLPGKSCSDSVVKDVIEAILKLDSNVVLCLFGLAERYTELEHLSNRLLVFNRVPLKLAAYLVSQMSLFIGVDSCFLHVADISRVPGIGLFGPTSPDLFGFRFARNIHFRNGLNDTTGDTIACAVRSLWDQDLPNFTK